jgi:hypothetical protein
MSKYSRYDPRNKNKDRNKKRSLAKDVRIRDADDYKDIHRYKGAKLDWVVIYDKKEDTEIPQ